MSDREVLRLFRFRPATIGFAFFVWLEEAPLPPESLRTLKSSLDEVVPSSKQT